MSKVVRTSKKIEPVNLSESTINMIDAAKVILFWILSKLASSCRSKLVKAVSESFEKLTLNVDINHYWNIDFKII